MVVAEERIARDHQIEADQDREEPADQSGGDREDDVERADVLVVGREQPALREGQMHLVITAMGMIVIAMGMIVAVGVIVTVGI